jgi:hypothetical protein
MAARLLELRAHLDSVSHCDDTCCAKGYTQFSVTAGDVAALREVLKSEEPATVCGLAAIHLRHLWPRDIDIVADFDSCVDIAQSAGLVPDDREPQQVLSPCPGALDVQQDSLAWSRHTLGELCLKTANSITSLQLSREEYRAWRRRYANPRDSLEMWQAMFRSRHPIDEALLADLERHSRELYVRAVLTHPEGLDSLGLDPSRVAARLSGVLGSAELVGLLESPARWPELADVERRDALAINLFTHWRVLLGEQAGPRLEALWDSTFASDASLVRYNLAWAVADAVPARRRAILKQGLAIPSVYPTKILERLAADYAREEPGLLVQWFKPPLTSEFSQAAILDGLAHAHPAPRHLLRTLVKLIGPSNGVLIQHAATTAKAMGCKLPPSMCERLSPWLGKRFVDKQEREKALKRAEDAQRECHAALLRCSVGW